MDCPNSSPSTGSDEYPIVEIPLKQLRYRWDHPTESLHSSVLDTYIQLESRLTHDLHNLVAKRDPTAMLYISIREEGMINPLIVKAGEGDLLEGQYFVVVGNQRLAALRAMSFHGGTLWNHADTPIKCVVAKPEDDWTDMTRARKEGPIVSMGFNPYKKRWVTNPPTDGWLRERDG